jgi:hypothetical protein
VSKLTVVGVCYLQGARGLGHWPLPCAHHLTPLDRGEGNR